MHRDDEAIVHLRMATEYLNQADRLLLKAAARYHGNDGAHAVIKMISDVSAVACNNANSLAVKLGAAPRLDPHRPWRTTLEQEAPLFPGDDAGPNCSALHLPERAPRRADERREVRTRDVNRRPGRGG